MLIALPKTLEHSHASSFGRMRAGNITAFQSKKGSADTHTPYLLVAHNPVDGKLHLQAKRFARELLRLEIVMSMSNGMRKRISRVL